MNKEEFTNLIENPQKINSLKTEQLDEVIHEFPYFQSARAIQLKGLNTTNSFKYNQALKKTAAYTIDRKILFEFITSLNFLNKTTISEIPILEEIDVIEPELINSLHKKITNSFVLDVNKESIKLREEEDIIPIEEHNLDILEIGKPIKFTSSEPQSFNQWMQLISQKSIEREVPQKIAILNTPNEDSKFNLIDKFIKSKPKIKPVDKNSINQEVIIEISSENDSLMTETLAKVYLEQKKYDNAIKAYRILSLKYPEKSGFFADRIKAIKILQRNKS